MLLPNVEWGEDEERAADEAWREVIAQNTAKKKPKAKPQPKRPQARPPRRKTPKSK